MQIVATDIVAGQYVWIRDDLWLVDSVTPTLVGGVRIRRPNGDVALLSGSAVVTAKEA